MIKNKRQYDHVTTKLRGLEASRSQVSPGDKSSWLSYTNLIDDAHHEIVAYDDLRDGLVTEFELRSIDDLGEGLIRARIARHLTQAQLADALGVSGQQVQKDEARDYEMAGLAKCGDALDALGYELVGVLRPRDPSKQVRAGESMSADLRADVVFEVPSVTDDLLSDQAGPTR